MVATIPSSSSCAGTITATEAPLGLATGFPTGRKRLAKHSTKKISAGIAMIAAATVTRIVSSVTGLTIVRL